MNEFRVIYKILSFLNKNAGNEEADLKMISAEVLGVSEAKWEQLIIELQRNGYIDGVVYSMAMNDKFPHIAHPITPRITLRGMEFLEENGMMKKASRMTNGVLGLAGDIISSVVDAK